MAAVTQLLVRTRQLPLCVASPEAVGRQKFRLVGLQPLVEYKEEASEGFAVCLTLLS